MPAKAVQRLVTAGMADDNADTETAMQLKFPAPPSNLSLASLPPAPPSNELTRDAVRGVVGAVATGAAPGPSGLRPDFLRKLIERGDSRSTLRVMAALSNLLADGKAPVPLAAWLAGAAGHAFCCKRAKPGR